MTTETKNSENTENETPAGATAQPQEQNDWRSAVRGSGRNQLIVLALTALLVLGGAWALGKRTPAAEGGQASIGNAQSIEVTGAKEGPAPEVGKPVQDLTLTTIEGERIRLSALEGSPVWLTFGASWCTACRAEAPDIEAAYKAGAPKGLKVVAVNMQESRDQIMAYVGRVGLTYPQVADPDTAIAARFRVMGLPTHFFIGTDGLLKSTHIGAMTRPAMDAELAKLGG